MPNVSALLESYATGTGLLTDVLRSAADVDLDARPIAGRWSIREVVCHLADSEIIYADRMKRVIAESEPTFFEADPDIFRPALHCQQRTLEAELGVINAVRRHMFPILYSLEESDFHRSGHHSLAGPMTLQTLLQRISDHIPHHLGFIQEKLTVLTR